MSTPAEVTSDAALPTAYPSAERLDLVEQLHGHSIADPYRWLEDADAPRSAEWSGRQDEIYAAFRASWLGEAEREQFSKRLGELADTGYVGTPHWYGDRAFFVRRSPGQEHPVLWLRTPDGTERVLIDPMDIDSAGLTTLDGCMPAPDGKLLAYLISEGGTEESVLRVIDVDSGKLVDGPIDRAKYTPVAWLPDGRSFFYVRRLAADQVPEGESQFHRRVYLHRLGTDAAEDVLVFGDGLEKINYYEPEVSPDGRWLAVHRSAGTSARNDVHLADLSGFHADGQGGSHAGPRFVALQDGVDAMTYASFGRDGRLYLSTNMDAPNGRLMVADPEHPEREHWRELLTEDAEAVLKDFALVTGPDNGELQILAVRTRRAVDELALHDADGKLLAQIALPGDGSIGDLFAGFPESGLISRPDPGPHAWFHYTDHTTPSRVYQFDAHSRELTLWARAEGDIELGSVHVERTTYRSKDGTEVQLTIMSPTGRPDRPRPTILYGYGGFNSSQVPGFIGMRLAWVEAGGVFAIANLRGGGEGGESWHRAGMFGNKQNVFDDFHAAGDHLVSQGWTTRDRLGIYGGSNGGLLVGAALTQRPDAYTAVICSAPLLDMLRYELFGLGTTWNVEYGSASVPEEFEWLLGYSPYHHVHERTAYPATLFTIFEGDSRVDTLHARKLAAALQHATSGDMAARPVLVRRELNVGHSVRSVSRGRALQTDQLAFFAHQLGLRGTPTHPAG